MLLKKRLLVLGLNVQIEYESEIEELINRYNNLSFLKNLNLSENTSYLWQRESGTSFDLQVMFIGKTGYGKSTTLNRIVGSKVFDTDDIASCTKALHSAEYKLHANKPYYFSLCDLPGVGESTEADDKYLEWYRDILIKSNCVVYVLRADQRDFSLDEKIFNSLFHNLSEKKKVIIGLNYADKIEPLNRHYPFKASEAQIKNLNERIDQVQRIFKVLKSNILFYSAGEGYNVENLVGMIKNVIQQQYR